MFLLRTHKQNRPSDSHFQKVLKSLIAIGICFTFVSSAVAQPKTTEIETYRWKELGAENKTPKHTEIVTDTVEGDVLKIERTQDSPQQISILTIESPKLTERLYMLQGMIKYEGVEQVGFLEMWSTFDGPKQGSYFSRTLDVTGPMGQITGSSGWRSFQIPFMVNDASVPLPSKLQLNIVIPGKGTVWLSDIKLAESPLVLPVNNTNSSNYNFLTYLLPFLGFAGVTFGIGCLLLMIRQQRRNQAVELRRMQAMNIE